ncbi:MAG: hypothetical protein QGG48_05695 [Desulfatiglandales bacterium]|nr:hypothetical protein [Desulfatiglandales bacterium]
MPMTFNQKICGEIKREYKRWREKLEEAFASTHEGSRNFLPFQIVQAERSISPKISRLKTLREISGFPTNIHLSLFNFLTGWHN